MCVLHVHYLPLGSPSLSRRGGPGSLRVASSILPWSRNHWHSPAPIQQVMRVAAQQLSKCEYCRMGLWMVLREITSSLLYFYLPICHFFIPLLPLQIQWGINQMPLLSKNVLVLALFSVSSYSLQSLQSLDTCSIHKVQGFSCVWLSEMMHYFDFCPYLFMFLTYAQLLVSWREEMHWPVSAWLYVRLNFKTLDTWRIPVSFHMWVCVLCGSKWGFLRFLKGFECGWPCIRAEPEWWLCRALKAWGEGGSTKDDSIYW